MQHIMVQTGELVLTIANHGLVNGDAVVLMIMQLHLLVLKIVMQQLIVILVQLTLHQTISNSK